MMSSVGKHDPRASSQEAVFRGAHALTYARAIAFPRKTGTEGETRAARAIRETLDHLGYSVREEPFAIRFPPGLWMRSFSFLCLLFLWGARLGGELHPGVGLLMSTLLILGVFFWERLWLRAGKWMVSDGAGGWPRSSNVVAEPARVSDGKPVYLVAHYDSKGDGLSLYARVILLLAGSFCVLFFSLWVWMSSLGLSREGVSVRWIAEGCFWVACGVNILVLLAPIGNRSSGAVDNASGVGVLLEVARIVKACPSERVRPIFLFTGAEEMGLLGSLMFQRKYGRTMLKCRAHLINVDSVGQVGKVRACSSGKEGARWLRRMLGVAGKKGLCVRRLPFRKGVLMDDLPFGRGGIPAVSLSSVWREGWAVHTSRDRTSLLQEDGLGEMGRVVLFFLEALNDGEDAPDPSHRGVRDDGC